MSTAQRLSILVVDDDEIILLALTQTFSKKYDVITERSPVEALKKLSEQDFAVILSDQRMNEMSGLEFLSKAREIQPHASRILITGVLSLETVIQSVNEGEIFRFLAKPWVKDELIKMVDDAATHYKFWLQRELNYTQLFSRNTELESLQAELVAKIEQVQEAVSKMQNDLSMNDTEALKQRLQSIQETIDIHAANSH